MQPPYFHLIEAPPQQAAGNALAIAVQGNYSAAAGLRKSREL